MRQRWWSGMAAILTLGVMLEPASAVTRTWATVGGTNDWWDGANWTNGSVPQAGDDVVITNAATGVLLTNATPYLGSFTISNTATLVFSNWNTSLSAASVAVVGQAVVTLPTAFTNTAMSNRIWMIGSTLWVGAGASLNADGRGYCGGTTTVASAGQGPGGGGAGSGYGSGGAYGGHGGAGLSGLAPGPGLPYGSAAYPLDAGSGGGANGGANQQGGHGGGAIALQFSGAVVVHGIVTANGLDSSPPSHASAGGSGGSILIECDTLTGTGGSLRANGGHGKNYAGGGGGGRIAIHYNPGSQTVAPAIGISAAPGTSPSGGVKSHGGAGSVWLPGPLFLPEVLNSNNFSGSVRGFTSWAPAGIAISNSCLQFAENGFVLSVTGDVHVSGPSGRLLLGGNAMRRDWYRAHLIYSDGTGVMFTAGGGLTLTNGASLSVYSGATNGTATNGGVLVALGGDLAMGTGCWIYAESHPTNGGAPLFRMRHLLISSPNSGFLADGWGYQGGGPGHANGWGPGGGYGFSSGRGTGGSYGGRGGYSTSTTNRAPVYGEASLPVESGSGGGWQGAAWGTPGGGNVRIEASGTVLVNGLISANGMNGVVSQDGAGSGGGVFVTCRAFVGNGVLQANGGSGSSFGSGGGGGGRIALWHAYANDSCGMTVIGGTNGIYGGEEGTIVRICTLKTGTVVVIQ